MVRGMSQEAWEAKQAFAQRLAEMDLPPGVKAIPLTKGQYTLVDAQDYDFLMQWQWNASNGEKGSQFYATRAVYIPLPGGGRKKAALRMHNLIMPPPEGMEIDHINGDTLDNRRCNLRVCIHAHNMRNLPKPRDGRTSSPYKGVSLHKQSGRWQAMIKVNYRQKWLGNYDDPKEAAAAYNRAALEHFGEYARLNEV